MPDLNCETAVDWARMVRLGAATMDDDGNPVPHPKVNNMVYYSGIETWLDLRAIFIVNETASYLEHIQETVWEDRKPRWDVIAVIVKPPTITIYTSKKNLSNREQLKWATAIRTLGRLPDNAKIVFSFRKDLPK